MAKRKSYKYTGVLSRPVYVPLRVASALQPDDTELRERVRAEHMGQYLDRLVALAKDCGVEWEEPIQWWKIAMVLAERHVPGFAVEDDYINGPPKRGRPKWKADSDFPIVIAIVKREVKGLSIRQAAAYVARERGKGESAAALERRYRRFNERIKEFQEEARQESVNAFSAAKRPPKGAA